MLQGKCYVIISDLAISLVFHRGGHEANNTQAVVLIFLH